jgi:uncharacterized protein YdaU (DUF1376 family)
MAKKTPSFQFYPSDFLGGVMLLNEEETGVYIKVLCSLWIQGNSIPYSVPTLARVTATPQDVLERVWPSIADKFAIIDGYLSHPRFEKMISLSQVRRETGGKGGRPPVGEKKANGNQTDNQNHNQNKSKTITKTETKTKANPLKNEERRMKNENIDKNKDDWVLPEGWDSEELRSALEGWESMRAKIRKPISSRVSASKIFKRFDSPRQLIEVCEFCEANDYQGLKPEYAGQVPKGGAMMTTARRREANMADDIRLAEEAEAKGAGVLDFFQNGSQKRLGAR